MKFKLIYRVLIVHALGFFLIQNTHAADGGVFSGYKADGTRSFLGMLTGRAATRGEDPRSLQKGAKKIETAGASLTIPGDVPHSMVGAAPRLVDAEAPRTEAQPAIDPARKHEYHLEQARQRKQAGDRNGAIGHLRIAKQIKHNIDMIQLRGKK